MRLRSIAKGRVDLTGVWAPSLLAEVPHSAAGQPLPHYGYPTWPDGQLRASVKDTAQILALLMNDGRAGDVQLLRPETVE